MKHAINIIFSRKLSFVILLGIQIFLLFYAYLQLSHYIPYIFGAFTLFATVVVIYEINREEYVDFKISWLVLIVALPIVGTILYIFFHLNVITRKIKQRSEEVLSETAGLLNHKDNDCLSGLSYYVNSRVFFPTYTNPQISFFSTGNDFYNELLKRLETAEKYIFIETFILQDGYMWKGIYGGF